MDAVVEEAAFEEIGEEIRAPAALLPPGVQQPINVVDGKPELILPSDHTYFTACARAMLPRAGEDTEVLSARQCYR
jgi:hypothetical protein